MVHSAPCADLFPRTNLNFSASLKRSAWGNGGTRTVGVLSGDKKSNAHSERSVRSQVKIKPLYIIINFSQDVKKDKPIKIKKSPPFISKTRRQKGPRPRAGTEKTNRSTESEKSLCGELLSRIIDTDLCGVAAEIVRSERLPAVVAGERYASPPVAHAAVDYPLLDL